MKLTEKQQLVKDRVMTANRGEIITLRGFAGTGKTVTASQIVKDFSFNGLKTLVLAPTAAALAVLKSKLFEVEHVDFKTIASVTSINSKYVMFSGLEEQKFHFDIGGVTRLAELLTAMKVDVDGIITFHTGSRNVDYAQFDPDYHTYKYISVSSHLLQSRLNRMSPTGKSPLGIASIDSEYMLVTPETVADKLDHYDLVVIDEFSMVSSTIEDLIKSAMDVAKCPPVMLVCGDGGQLQPVEGEVNSRIVSDPDDDTVFELTEILRSTDDIAYMAQDVRSGLPMIVMSNKWPDLIEVVEDTKISDLFVTRKELFTSADVVLTFTNQSVNTLNTLVRRELGLPKELTVNDKIVINKNSGYAYGRPPMYVNGELCDVIDIVDPEGAIRLLDDQGLKRAVGLDDYDIVCGSLLLGKVRLAKLLTRDDDIKFALLDEAMTGKQSSDQAIKVSTVMGDVAGKVGIGYADAKYAYAMTVHKAQGSEWDNVVYVVSSKDLYIQKTWHAPYTAITRAKKSIKVIYTK